MPIDTDDEELDEDMVIRATRDDHLAADLGPEVMLLTLIMKHTDGTGITVGHLYELADTAVAAAGSVQVAIEALESGQMRLDRK